MLCGGLKSNGLADPFKNNEDDTFPEEQLPIPLQEHNPSDHPSRRPRTAAAALQPYMAPPFNPYMQLQYPMPHLYPGHALSNSHAMPAVHAMMPGSFQHSSSGVTNSNAAAAMAMGAPQILPMARPLARTGASDSASAKTDLPSEAQPSSATEATDAAGSVCLESDVVAASVASAGQDAQQTESMQPAVSLPQQAWGGPPFGPPVMMPPNLSAPVGTTGIMHRPLPYPPPSSLPSLFQPTGQPEAAALQALSGMQGGNFPLTPQAMSEGFPQLYFGAARLYAQHMSGPFGKAPGADASMCGPAGFNPFLHMPFGANGVLGSQASPAAAGSDHAAGSGSAQAAESSRKRKAPAASQKRQGAGKSGISFFV